MFFPELMLNSLLRFVSNISSLRLGLKSSSSTLALVWSGVCSYLVPGSSAIFKGFFMPTSSGESFMSTFVFFLIFFGLGWFDLKPLAGVCCPLRNGDEYSLFLVTNTIGFEIRGEIDCWVVCCCCIVLNGFCYSIVFFIVVVAFAGALTVNCLPVTCAKAVSSPDSFMTLKPPELKVSFGDIGMRVLIGLFPDFPSFKRIGLDFSVSLSCPAANEEAIGRPSSPI